MSAIYRNAEQLQSEIDATQTLITRVTEAITALTIGGVDMYQLDTGQTRTYVQKARLPALRELLAFLDNRLSTLQAKLCGASVIGRPGH